VELEGWQTSEVPNNRKAGKSQKAVLRNHQGGIQKSREGCLDLQAVLRGEITMGNKYYLKTLLIREIIFEEKCSRCGYKDKRILNHSVTLVLDFIDGNQENQQ